MKFLIIIYILIILDIINGKKIFLNFEFKLCISTYMKNNDYIIIFLFVFFRIKRSIVIINDFLISICFVVV